MSNNKNVFVNNGLTVKLDGNIADPQGSVFDNIPNGTVVELAEDIELNKALTIKSDVVIIGNGHGFVGGENFVGNTDLEKNLVTVIDADVVLQDTTIKAGSKNRHALNLYNSQVIFQGKVVLDHEKAITGAPLIINGSSAFVLGDLNIVTGANSWYGINVDSKIDGKLGSISFGENASLTQTGDKPIIFVDDETKGEVLGGENVDLVANEDGSFRKEIVPASVKLNKENLELKVGEKFALVATIAPENADNKTLAWASSDNTVVSVNQNGNIEALKPGKAVITVKTANGLEAKCEVVVAAQTVTENPLMGDNSNIALYAGVLFVSALLMAFAAKKAFAKR